MPMSLAEAAAACGINRSTVLRAVKAGKISGARDVHGNWTVEAAELHRIFPPKADREQVPQHAHTEALIGLLQKRIAELETDRDAWREQAQRLALAAPRPAEAEPPNDARASVKPVGRWRRAWRWCRGA